jgi:transcriptional regulator with XRE-family HTH domain
MVDNNAPCNSDLPQRLGRNIAKRRKQLGWTQAYLAEQMKLEPESISRFERGATLPSLTTLELLARKLNVSIADLLAEYSGAAYSEAQRISGWLSKLQPDAKKTVLDGLQKICALLDRH